jgi:hypothetical protein
MHEVDNLLVKLDACGHVPIKSGDYFGPKKKVAEGNVFGSE